MCVSLLFQSEICLGGVASVGNIFPGFQGSQMNWIDSAGMFLESNNGEFTFGFTTIPSDIFMFDQNGNAFLQKGATIVWSTDTENKGVSSMELQDTGNLAFLGNNSNIIWQSFSHPTQTLLSKQDFTEGMKLISDPNSNNLAYVLEIKSGDLILSADFQTPQPYWSMKKDNRKVVDKDGDLMVASATLSENSWRFYDKNMSLLWQFIFAEDPGINSTWVATLGSDGFITFSNLQSEKLSTTRIPQNSCSTPQPCDSYNICTGDNNCRCPSVLSSRPNCKPGNVVSSCNDSETSTELMEADNGIHYFALDFLPPSSTTDLDGCKASCLGNCSCLVMFFHNITRKCFLLDNIGSFQASDTNSGFVSYIKLSKRGGGSSNKHTIVVVVIIVLSALLVLLCVVCVGLRYSRRKRKMLDSPEDDNSNDDMFLGNIRGMPIRFSYEEMKVATNNFSEKLGQGGFGSVYKGVLQDGSQVAVKKLEGIEQGKKEFRAEVSIIGSIHHHHLVKLKGFCAEGSHRLLAYEYMANRSLDKWIFKKNEGESELMLDWNTRYNIALGTAKGLAYLHEDCDSKIIHCDIKPENVLLDDKFLAKVSDLGLAKLMTREQSHVFTTLRGTRGYLAPEWITNYAISEKSDVYSYGMVLLEIIGGRKNYDPNETSEKSHFPSLAFKRMEEGKVRDIIDSKMKIDETDERVDRAIKVSLWCIQEDMSLRPSMAKVVQMLEGLSAVPKPPTCSPLGFRLYSTLVQHNSEEGTSLGHSDSKNFDAYHSAVRLSGPR
ncbi:G-type lectin S-receptor-like serine/threonine-protein kinase SD2-5 [Senna tora]|uniref:Receptor-like serine/threonine-protein kinase n=1 Tax=Senna tora TaxID=362788 RepID=A0A834T7M0_9FABA|nr:G-type lectin S-receptor-like serine/threonine-protein kinase SD2-5 [Senna tora]